eukprot:TRINITY_DN135244_c1_g1_i1.p1 TRINITY_DN135244_c1_g1~~TRINITY_DN135244_c1_g1_i1.p1  ORF type:complete len:959 (-),score=137.76 TRINITY_DN135244_c1_g1_i1:45-2921(-)
MHMHKGANRLKTGQHDQIHLNKMILNPSPLKGLNQPLFLGNMFDIINQKLSGESKGLKSMDQFFKESRKLLEHIAKTLSSMQGFHKALPETSYSLKTAASAIANEINEFVTEVTDVKDQIQQDVVEPLQVFKKHFDTNLSAIGKQATALLTELSEARKHAEKAKKVYLGNAEKLEKAQGALKSLVGAMNEGSPVQALKDKTTNIIEKKGKMEDSEEEYKKSVANVNKMLDKKMKDYEYLAETMLQLDESRVGLIKSLFEKQVKYMEQIAKKFLNKAVSMQNMIECINAKSDIELFTSENENSALNPLFIPLECEQYEYKDPSVRIIEGVPVKDKETEESKAMELLRLDFEQAMITLTDGKPLSVEQKTTLIEHLHKIEGREVFAELLSNITQPLSIVSVESLKSMGEIVNYLLNTYFMDRVYDDEILLIVINASRNIYCKVENKKQFLYSLISHNPIWQSMDRWRELINISIQQKIEELQEVADRQLTLKSAQLGGSPEGNRGIMRKFKKALGEMFSGPNSKSPVLPKKDWGDRKIIISAATYTLNQYATLLTNFHVKPENARHVLRYYGKMYGVDPAKICEAELDLMVLQPVEESHIHKINANKQGHKYKGGAKSMIIALAVPYIKDKSTLRNILLLSKSTYNTTKVKVFKQVLEKLEIAMPMRVRGQIWAQALDINTLKETNYYKIITSIKEKAITLPKSIEDVIALDVQRSFSGSKVVDPISVKNVLRAYACYNQKVEYCQGMNFVAGFLLYFLQDEAKTFKALVQLIEKFGMDDLFAQDVPLLKKYFFQMDRLYFLHYPELAEYLKIEGVGSSYYSSTWFMTLFTNTFLYSKDETPPATLLTVWDEFLMHGWKAVFKTGLFILAELQDKLLELKFDEIMMVLGDVAKSGIFHNPASNIKLKEMMRKTKVTKELLEKLGKEYDDTFEGVKKVVEQESEMVWAPPEDFDQFVLQHA